MKKISSICLIALLLCGCANATMTGDSDKETQPEYYVDIDNTVYYESEEEFFASEFCDTMREEGFMPYQLVYDKECYTLTEIRSGAYFYEYHLSDNATGESAEISISYDTYVENVEQFGEDELASGEAFITTAEKDGMEYDVYIAKIPFVEYSEYYLMYLPFEKYEMGIFTNRATSEEALADFQEFDLIPVESSDIGGYGDVTESEKSEPVMYICGDGACIEVYEEDLLAESVWVADVTETQP